MRLQRCLAQGQPILAEVMAVAGERLGSLPDLSVHLARKTVSGAGALMAAEPKIEAAQLRSNVISEGGTTAAALAVLQAEDGLQPVDRALRAAFDEGRNWTVGDMPHIDGTTRGE